MFLGNKKLEVWVKLLHQLNSMVQSTWRRREVKLSAISNDKNVNFFLPSIHPMNNENMWKMKTYIKKYFWILLLQMRISFLLFWKHSSELKCRYFRNKRWKTKILFLPNHNSTTFLNIIHWKINDIALWSFEREYFN